MIARHPTTGAPIRILRSEATLSKHANTAVWIEPSFTPSHRWSRWSTILSDASALPVLKESIPSILILRTAADVAAWNDWITTHPTCDTILFITEVVDRALKECPLMCLGIADLNQLYPFLQQTLTDTSPLEDVVAAICHLVRFHKLITARSSVPSLWHGTVVPVPLDTTDAIVPRTYWISQYFEPSHPARAREIRECLERNIQCPYIDHILLLTEKECILPSSEKIIHHPFGKRATYADTFQTAMDRIPSGHQSILLFSNSDIWFDSTLRALWSINLQEKICLALLRWEGKTIYGPRPDSQDTWIVGRDAFTLDLTPFRFNYGVPGCDNVVSVELFKQKYLIVNPAYTIHTHHHHASSIRSYRARDDILFSPIYLHITPTAIQSFGTTTSFGAPVPWSMPVSASFARESLSIRDAPRSLSVYTPSPPPTLYHIERSSGIFVSPENLLYDFHSLWVNDASKPRWSSSTLHTLAPTIALSSMITMLGAETADPAAWMLSTAPWILRILALDPGAHYVIPAFLQSLFPRGCAYQSNVQYWSRSVWTIPSLSAPPTQEDIQLLRSYCKGAAAPTGVPTILFLISDDLITHDHAEQMYKIHCVHETTAWAVHYLHTSESIATIQRAFQAANWIIGESTHPLIQWCWMSPPGSTLLEFQKENESSDTLIHLAGAAALHHVQGIQQFREPVEDRRQRALVDLGIALRRHGMTSLLKEVTSRGTAALPVIILPTDMTGIHIHSGDSFRAMIQLWGERGYCRIETSRSTPFCWWDGIGTTLLYDRDTMKWMDLATPSYRLALIGNPAPTDRLRQSRWSYWSRHPRLVEAVHPLSWKERPLTSIFLGRIENGVQMKHRTGHTWASVIELFECPVDSSGGPYKYSPSEYLEKVRRAKFGLCLAGFGSKCHREIEYYACGTVPIATPDCDMTGYLHPPVEGVHFLRASTPAELTRVIAATSVATWERMSAAGRAWWRENASAEGLFRLTAARIQRCLPYAGIGIPAPS
jgi:hypothetical protein